MSISAAKNNTFHKDSAKIKFTMITNTFETIDLAKKKETRHLNTVSDTVTYQVTDRSN